MAASASVAGKVDISKLPEGTIHDSLGRTRSSVTELPEGLSMYRITDKEKTMIDQIRARLGVSASSRYDDIRICRFLRREKEMDKTEAMIRKEMEWRQQARPDQIFEEFPKNKYFKSLIQYWPGGLHGIDKYGVPILFERLGAIDLHSLLGKVPAEVLLEFHIYTIEKNDRILSEHFKRLGAPVGYVYVMDLTGLSLKHYNASSIDILKKIQNIDDNYYPEFLRKVLVLHTPAVFSMFWSLAKVVMHKQSAAKFCVLKKDFQDELNAITTPDQVPGWLNGSCHTCEHRNTGCKFGGDKFHLLE